MLQAITSAHASQSPQRPIPQQDQVSDYTWKIANFTRKLAQANSNNDCGDMESEPFFSSHGYKMKLSTRLNEGPTGETGYMGLYFHLMKSDRDGLLSWPFTKGYTFVLVDQQDDPDERHNITCVQIPDGERYFKRPRQRENNGVGVSRFVKHSTLRTRQYIRDHAVYIKIFIEP